MKYAFKRQFGKDNYLMKFLQIVTNVKETLRTSASIFLPITFRVSSVPDGDKN